MRQIAASFIGCTWSVVFLAVLIHFIEKRNRFKIQEKMRERKS